MGQTARGGKFKYWHHSTSARLDRRRGHARPPLAAARAATLALAVAMALPGAVHAAGETPAAQARPARKAFDIAAGPLEAVLNRFGREAGILLSYPTELAAGLGSRGLRGSYTVQEALPLLLADTGLVAVAQANGGYVLTKRAEPQAAAGVSPASKDVILPAVRVEASAEQPGQLPQSYVGGQVARGGRLGMLGNQDLMDAPFNITSYTAQTIADRQAVTVADVVAGDPSIRNAGQAGDVLDSFFIRGFPLGDQNSGEIAFDGVYGVAPNYRVLTDYAERIEVIKGPAALLYGMSPASSVGGVINIVPKRAGDVDLTRLTAGYASDSQLSGQVDLSRRFGADRQFGVRINGSQQGGDTALDNQSREARVGALALDYRGERLRASVDIIDQREDVDAPSRRPFLAAGLEVPSAPDGRRNVTQDWEWFKTEDRSLLLRTEYDVTDALTVFADAGSGRTRVDRLFGNPFVVNAAGDTSTTPQRFEFEVDRSTADLGLRTRFATGTVRHSVALQATAYREVLDRGSANGTAVSSNLYRPVDRPEQDVGAPARVPKVSETELAGVALSDTLSMMDDRLQLTLGVRRQKVLSDNFNPLTGAVSSSYDESAVTPLAGLVVKPWHNLSLYANYIEGLSKGDAAPNTATNAGEVFAPYKSRQAEIGAKLDHGRFATTLSVFQIRKPSGQLTAGRFAVDGEQRNRGLELLMFGETAPGLRVLGGVTLLDAELTKTNSAATRGKTAVGAPELLANLGLEWDAGFLPGLTFTGDVVHTGEQYVDRANTQRLPEWTTLDLGARYRTRIGGKHTTFRAAVRNVFDREYWAGASQWGSLVQGAPRTLSLSATVDF